MLNNNVTKKSKMFTNGHTKFTNSNVVINPLRKTERQENGDEAIEYNHEIQSLLEKKPSVKKLVECIENKPENIIIKAEEPPKKETKLLFMNRYKNLCKKDDK